MSITGADIPADLRAAMQARDEAFYSVNSAQWSKYTSPTFTTVQQDGSFMTRAERLANLQTQTPKPYVARFREQNEQRGDLVVARFFSGGPMGAGSLDARGRWVDGPDVPSHHG